MAGLALIGLLVTFILNRKRKWKAKLTIKKKTMTEEENDSQGGEEGLQMGNVLASLEALEKRRSIASPRSFEFGFNPATAPLPSLPKHSTAAQPPQWI